MAPVFKLLRNDISPSIRRYATEMKRSLRDVVKSTAKGITRIMIDNTPPNSADGRGLDGRRAGEAKISRQMHSVLRPVKLKGRRRITTVFGHKLKRPIYVPTKEKYPDVAGLYRERVKARGTGIGISTVRGAPLFVDTRKFDAELKRRQANVGKLAAGWNAAATALDLPVQHWIARHGGSGGTVQIDTAGDRMRVTVENLAPGVPANVRADIARRIPYAVEYQAAGMERQINAYHNRTKQELGIAGQPRAA